MRWKCKLTTLLFIASASPVAAGPPLIADDPHTVGAGRMELIVDAIPVRAQDGVEWSAPHIDITVGVLDRFDFVVNGSPVFSATEPARGALSVGFKWQPIRGDRWNASFTPAAGFTFSDESSPVNPRLGVAAEVGIFLPVQIEHRIGRWAVGVDGGYAVVVDGGNSWLTGLYAGVEVFDSLTLLTEFVAEPSSSQGGTHLGLGGGFDWTTPLGFHVLASGFGVVATTEGSFRPWRAYFGLLWEIPLWEPR